ncbi:MAG: sulfatase-like hydrolase/transferase, partial [Thermoguttaceae bacterium]|nr:sulfatase-like hydrolase/transferase [Thermoguttaceae bacterium]
MPPVLGKNILCLAVDRLNADFLGAYGNAWIDAPAFDSLAAESALFDSYFTTSLDLTALYEAFWRGVHPGRVALESDSAESEAPSIFELLKEAGYRAFIVSDDESVALHPAGEACDGRFLLDELEADAPAEGLEETQIFHNFEELARFLVKLESDGAEINGKPAPWFVWAHFSGWAKRWDFPAEFREKYREDEEDPAPYAGVVPPAFAREAQEAGSARRQNDENRESAAPAEAAEFAEVGEFSEAARAAYSEESARLAQLDADDRRQAVVEAYSGGVAVFDETLAGFVAFLSEHEILSKTLFLTLGTRGYSTGFPGILGRSTPFYSECVRAPLAIRFPNGAGATVRLASLCEPRDVFATIRDWPTFAPRLATAEFWSGAADGENSAGENGGAGRNLALYLADEDAKYREKILIVGAGAESAERALVTEDWLLKSTPTPEDAETPGPRRKLELFVRPDDVYCVNDVASRCVDTVEELAAALD